MHPALLRKDYHQPLNSPLTDAGMEGLSAFESGPIGPRLDFAHRPKPRSAALVS